MKKKCLSLSLSCLILALADFVFCYLLFHYLSPDGSFGIVFNSIPVKPFVTVLFGVLGVLLLFSSIMSLLVYLIFYRDRN